MARCAYICLSPEAQKQSTGRWAILALVLAARGDVQCATCWLTAERTSPMGRSWAGPLRSGPCVHMYAMCIAAVIMNGVGTPPCDRCRGIR